MFNVAALARPYFGAVVLTTALLTGAGIYSAARMPSGVYPEVTFPRIAVVAKKPGFDLVNMEIQVTRPLEEAVSTVIGVVTEARPPPWSRGPGSTAASARLRRAAHARACL